MFKKITRCCLVAVIAVLMVGALCFVAFPKETTKTAKAYGEPFATSDYIGTVGIPVSGYTFNDLKDAVENNDIAYANYHFYELDPSFTGSLYVNIYKDAGGTEEVNYSDSVQPNTTYYIQISATGDVNFNTEPDIIEIYAAPMFENALSASELTSVYGEEFTYTNASWFRNVASQFSTQFIENEDDPGNYFNDVDIDLYFVDGEGDEIEVSDLDAGTYTLKASLTGNDMDKYVLKYEEYEYTITPKDITVSFEDIFGETVSDGDTKTYTYTGNAISLTPISNIDLVNATLSITSWTKDGNQANSILGAGSYSAPIVEINGEGSGNYNITANPTVNITVLKRTVTISVGASTEYIAQATNPTPTITPILSAEEQTANLTAENIGIVLPILNLSGQETNAGTGYTLTMTLADNDNYQIDTDGQGTMANSTFATYAITKATLTVTANVGINYGDDAPNYTNEISIAGFKGSDELGDFTITGTVTASCADYDTEDPTKRNVGEYTISLSGSYNDLDNYTFENVNGTLTVSKKEITITADDKTTTYGTAFDSFTATPSGLVYNETLNDLTGTLGYACDYDSTDSNHRSATTYTITPSGLTSSNYEIQFSAGTLTVNAKDATITAVGKTITYGDAAPALNTYTVNYSGFVNDDQNNLTGTLTYVCEYVQYGNVGNYDVTVSGLSSSNYNITFVKGTLVVNPATITVTSVAQEGTLTYNGADQQIAVAKTVSSVNNQEITFKYSKTASDYSTTLPSYKDANTYTVYYEFTAPNHSAATGSFQVAIAKAPLTITAVGTTITYGDAAPALNTYTVNYSEFVGEETSAVLGGEAVFACAYAQYDNVGSYDVTVSGITSDNYQITFDEGTLTVEQKEITITWTNLSAGDLVYSGTDKVVNPSTTGILAEDAETCVLGKTLTSGSTKNVGTFTYTATLTGDKAGNYKIISDETASYTITKKALTVTAGTNVTDDTITYGDVAPTYTVSYNGFVVGENENTENIFSAIIVASCSYSQYDDVNTYNITLNDTVTSDNYDITFEAGTLTVNAKDATITAVGKTITYGEAAPALNTYTVNYSGFVNDDQNNLTGTLTYACEYVQYGNVGNYDVTVSGLSSSNYNITFVKGTLTVEQKEVGLNWTELTEGDLVYSGTAKTLSATATGLVNNDTCTVTVALTEENTNVNVGSFTYTATALSNGNYKLPTNAISASYTITKATLTVTAVGTTITYGDAEPALNTYTVNYSGFVNSETSAVLGGEAVFACEYAQYGNVGNYDVTVSGLSSSNYTITFVKGTLTVEQKEVEISWSNTALTYTGSAQAPTASVTNAVNGDKVSVTVTGEQTNASNSAYIATAVLTENTNYKLSDDNENRTHEFTIGKLEIELSWSNDELIYNGSAQKPTVTATNLSTGDQIELSVSGEQTNASNSAYIATAVLTENTNYKLSNDNENRTHTFTISKAPLTITADNKSVIYGDIAPEYTVSYVGFVNNETEDVLSGSLSKACSYTAAANYEASYTITPSGLTSDNYQISFVAGTLTVNKRTVGINWTNLTAEQLVYSGTNKEVTATPTNVANGHIVSFTISLDGDINNVSTFTYTVTGFNENGYTTGYELPVEGLSASYTITKKALTVTADNKSITYGDVSPEFTATFTGFVDNEEEQNLDGKLAFACDYVNEAGNMNRVVGDYSITPSGLTSTNYEITFNEGNLTVAKRQIQIAVHNKESIYGSAQVDLVANYNGTADYAAVYEEGETAFGYDHVVFFLTCEVDETTSVGTYDIVPTIAEAYTANYELASSVENGTYTVTPATITNVTIAQDGTLTYNGSAQTASVTKSATTVNNQAVTFTYSLDENGTYLETVPQLTDAIVNRIVYFKANAANHIEATGSFTITIAKATMTDVSVAQTGTLTYNGAAQTATIQENATTVDETQVTFIYSADPNAQPVDFESELPEFTNAGNYTVFFRANATNHEEFSGSFTITIAKATVGLTWLTLTADQLVYDRTEKTLTATATGLVGTDTCVVTVAVTGGQNNVNVGSFTYTATGLTGTNSENYKLPINVVSDSYTITAKPVDIEWKWPTSYVYDKTEKRATVVVKSDDLIKGDKCDVYYSPNRSDLVSVGTISYTVSGLSNPNYRINNANNNNYYNRAYSITPREVTLTWSETNLAYNGTKQNPVVTAIGNVIDGDDVKISGYTIIGGTGINAGDYTVEASGLTNANYKLPSNKSIDYVIIKSAVVNEPISEEKAAREGVNITEVFKNVDTKAEDAELEIKIGETSIVFDKSAIEALAGAKNVKLVMETKTGDDATDIVKDAEMVFEISLLGAKFENGTATITADFENKAPFGKVAKVYYVDENGKLTNMYGEFKDGKVTFSTNHFSTYIVKYEIATGTIAGIIIACVLFVVIVIFAIIWFVIKKKNFKDLGTACKKVFCKKNEKKDADIEFKKEDVVENKTVKAKDDEKKSEKKFKSTTAPIKKSSERIKK